MNFEFWFHSNSVENPLLDKESVCRVVAWWAKKNEWVSSAEAHRLRKYMPEHTYTINSRNGWQMRFKKKSSGRAREESFLVCTQVCTPSSVSYADGSLINSFGWRSWQWRWRYWWRWRIMTFFQLVESQIGRRGWFGPHDEFWPPRVLNLWVTADVADFRSPTCLRNLFASLAAISSRLWHS